MIARRALVVVALVLSSVGFAQDAGDSHQPSLALKVVDPSGAVIPGARVEISALEHDIGTTAIADFEGRVVLHLEPGTYTVDVSAPGFKRWRRTNLELKRDSGIALEAQLLIGEQYCGPVVSAENIIQPEPAEPLSAAISSEPLDRMEELPRRKLPRYLRPRLTAN